MQMVELALLRSIESLCGKTGLQGSRLHQMISGICPNAMTVISQVHCLGM